MAREESKAGNKASADDPLKSKLEAVAAGIGAVLAIGTLGVIAWDGWREGDRPALVELAAQSVHEHPAGFVVEIVAVNSGDKTAAGLIVEGTLNRGGEVVEASEATFDYLPRRSERRGALVFSQDPRSFDLRLRAKGYAEP